MPRVYKKTVLGCHGLLTCIDRNTVTPKQAKLQLLTLAADMDSLKGHIIEGIGDM